MAQSDDQFASSGIPHTGGLIGAGGYDPPGLRIELNPMNGSPMQEFGALRLSRSDVIDLSHPSATGRYQNTAVGTEGAMETRAVPSALAVTTRRPSALKAACQTMPVC